MKKITSAALVLIAALTLTGCGDDTTADAKPQAIAQSTERQGTETQESPTPDDTTPPLVAETPEASSADTQFLADVRDRLSGLGAATTIPNATDEQLIAAGHRVCDALKAGTPLDDVTVIEGEQRVQGSYLDSTAISRSGILFYCPELNGNLD